MLLKITDLPESDVFRKLSLGVFDLENPKFLKFIELLANLNHSDKIPSKHCRACGKMYADLHEYIWDTEAKGQTMEDVGGVMDKAYTMLYRNCSCGNTLVLTLTGDNFPELSEFWDMIKQESKDRQLPVKTIVSAFMADWEHFIEKQTKKNKKITRKL